MRNTPLFIKLVLALVVAMLAGCSKPQQKLVGTWLPDVQESKAHNTEQLRANPFAEMALTIAAGTMRFEFTDSEMIAQIGNEKLSNKYDFVSFKDGVMTIKTADGNEKSVRFLTDDTMVLVGSSKDKGPEIVLKRVK